MSETQTNTIGKEFTFAELMKFVAPPVVTRLFVSLLSTLDDSLFVSRYCGQNALAAFSIALPWFMFVEALGMMVSSISIICSIKMGEKKNEEAKSDFTTMVLVALGIGAILTLILSLFLDKILLFLGETELLMPYAKTYMNVSRFYVPLILTSYIFSSFYVIAGKPRWAMYSQLINILCQFFFDYLFIVRLDTGIVGAAYANLIGSIFVNILAFIFFSNKEREIHFTKPHKDIWGLLKKVMVYGRMQFFTSMAISLSSYINNQVQLGIGGEEVVAAFTIVSNVTFMFMNSFFGLIGSTSPIASYAYGERNAKKLSRICKQTVVLVTILMCIIILIIVSGKNLIINLYLTESSSEKVRQMASLGLSIYPMALLFFGYNVLVEDFSNALGLHKTSLFLSTMENVVFQNSAAILLPYIFGLNGVWYVFLVTEVLTFFITVVIVYINKDVYGYGKEGIATFVNK